MREILQINQGFVHLPVQTYGFRVFQYLLYAMFLRILVSCAKAGKKCVNILLTIGEIMILVKGDTVGTDFDAQTDANFWQNSCEFYGGSLGKDPEGALMTGLKAALTYAARIDRCMPLLDKVSLSTCRETVIACLSQAGREVDLVNPAVIATLMQHKNSARSVRDILDASKLLSLRAACFIAEFLGPLGGKKP